MNIKKLIASTAAALMLAMSCAPAASATYFFTPEKSSKTYAMEDNNTYTKTGWLKFNDDTYYVNKDGSLKTGWLTLKSGAKYYFGKDGKMQTSKFIKDSKGNKYYLQKNGKMATGKLTVGDKQYTFDDNGVLKSTKTISKTDDKPKQETKQEKPIYATKSGKCWHYDNHCNNAKYHEITREEAEKLKLRPCEKCAQ